LKTVIEPSRAPGQTKGSSIKGLLKLTRAPDERADLDLVNKFFGERGLRLERFAKAETRAGIKTPDVRIVVGDRLVAYCEVKSPRDEWLDDQFDSALPGEIVGGCRPDPIFNRLGRIVRRAAEQFDAVNSDRALPNILVVVSHDEKSGPADLQETLTGNFHAEDGSRHPTMKRVSEGEIRELKRRIDLYIWIDGKSGKAHYFFSEADPAHVTSLCAALRLDETQIEHST
jgi:hypothetical protein